MFYFFFFFLYIENLFIINISFEIFGIILIFTIIKCRYTSNENKSCLVFFSMNSGSLPFFLENVWSIYNLICFTDIETGSNWLNFLWLVMEFQRYETHSFPLFCWTIVKLNVCFLQTKQILTDARHSWPFSRLRYITFWYFWEKATTPCIGSLQWRSSGSDSLPLYIGHFPTSYMKIFYRKII